jgi:hypothetical protein
MGGCDGRIGKREGKKDGEMDKLAKDKKGFSRRTEDPDTGR